MNEISNLGVCDCWVINAVTLDTRVHRDPAAAGFASVCTVAANQTLVPAFMPSVAIRLADLGLD